MVWLRELGYTVDKVEQRVPYSRRTRDAFGFADILAVGNAPGALLVQATDDGAPQGSAGGHLMDRVTKVQAEPRAKEWVFWGNRIWVVGWGLRGGQGKRKLWVPRVITFAGTVETYTENGGPARRRMRGDG